MSGDAEAAAGLVSASGAPAAPALPSPSSAADIRLFGKVDDAMLRDFLGQLDLARQRPGPLLLELTTTGGDADVGRRIALEMRLLAESRIEPVSFLGKTVISAAAG